LEKKKENPHYSGENQCGFGPQEGGGVKSNGFKSLRCRMSGFVRGAI